MRRATIQFCEYTGCRPANFSVPMSSLHASTHPQPWSMMSRLCPVISCLAASGFSTSLFLDDRDDEEVERLEGTKPHFETLK